MIYTCEAADTGIFMVTTILNAPGPTSAVTDTAGVFWTRITIQPYIARSLTIGSATGKRFCTAVDNQYVYMCVIQGIG